MRNFLTRVAYGALMTAWIGSAALAASIDGYSLPDTYPVEGQTLRINGIGLRTLTVFNVKVYVAGLYLSQPSSNARQILDSPGPKVILLQFLHAGSKADVEKQFRAGEANNCSGGRCDKADETDFEKLVAAAPAVKVGDTSTYIFTSRGVRVLANDRVIGEFANKDLAFHLLEGFIGDHPPSAELKAQLLGAK